MPFHIKRVAATLELQKPGTEVLKVEAQVLLNDFSPTGMGLFTGHHFNTDDEIIVRLESPKKIEVKGRIAWCEEYSMAGKVLKAQACPFRAGVQFKFATPEEEQAIKDFCDELLNLHQCVSLNVA